MKKLIVFVFVMLFTFSATMAFASKKDRTADSDKMAVPAKTENKMSEEEITRLTKRVEEIRKMDKSELTSEEKSELKSEMKEIKKNVKKAGGTIYISGAALVLIILLVILLV